MFNGRRKDNVYKINFSELSYQKILFLLLASDGKWIWHKRFGHSIWRLISKHSKLKLVKGFPELNYQSDVLCGAFREGKINKNLI